MRYGPWHRWFAWHPVPLTTGGWAWLRTVERVACYIDPGDWTVFDPTYLYRPTHANRREVRE